MRKKIEEHQRRMGQSPHPLPVYRRGAAVHVYMGAGWNKASVTESTRDWCSVWINKIQRQVTIHDARNVYLLSSSDQ